MEPGIREDLNQIKEIGRAVGLLEAERLILDAAKLALEKRDFATAMSLNLISTKLRTEIAKIEKKTKE